ncbi:1-acyl-sn-glycerol-3-phosphate acyltransferase [Pseudosulfitobacter koreensis]|uniref:Glycerol-3-phosphate acyltransferase n=1 Tax=Pseudosulfitobacter koreensis TaxID=2968472 RepID=A0ABT1Z2S8_9RHOB|nr:1-acyl-sn-glycerol-3-phosphate acyltransferase [Pseudosulfitobacter koreense]MCR8827423.1 1-acyl-sn-glycerol-3-phosphate acyltransferase [Pseudosulfitobacter koreense]
MTQTIELPLWLFIVIVLFATVTALSHFLLPSVRWFFRRRLERAVERLNTRLTRPIEPFKLAHRHDMIQRLVYDPKVTQAIVEHARKEGVPENVAFEQAKRYAREIVPSFSAIAYFGFGIRVARFLANTLYDVRTGLLNETALKNVSPDATVIFVMNHRSNMDYVLVTYLAARASALSYAVGEWARVWPLSVLIKSMGAYFIRRKSRGALYRGVLQRYVQMATVGGATQAIFPEGGLSLSGKVMPPKLGLLSYVVEAWEESDREVVFVPVAINYDRVLEDRILISANNEGSRRFRARISVVLFYIFRKGWLRLFGKQVRFGEAAVVFGQPVALSSYAPKPDIQALAADLMRRIENEMPLSFVPVLSRVMLNAAEPMDADALQAAMQTEIHAAKTNVLASRSSISAISLKARDHILRRGLIVEKDGLYAMNPEERDVLVYYANSIAHFYENAAPAP